MPGSCGRCPAARMVVGCAVRLRGLWWAPARPGACCAWSDLDHGPVDGDAVVVDDRRGGEHLALAGVDELHAHDGAETDQVPDALIGVIAVHLDNPAVLARHPAPPTGGVPFPA